MWKQWRPPPEAPTSSSRVEKYRIKHRLQLCGVGLLVVFASLSCVLVVLQLGWDDGFERDGVLNERAPTDLECFRSRLRSRSAAARLNVPLAREGRGVVLVGPAEPRLRLSVTAIVRQGAGGSRPVSCCARRGEWDFGKLAHRRAIRASSGFPFLTWTQPIKSYHPFLFAAVPEANHQLVLVVSDPVDRLIRRWTAHSRRTLAELVKLGNATQNDDARRRVEARVGFPLDGMARQLAGSQDDRCFEHLFQQRLQALSRGSWLPIVVERLDESLVVLATAYSWKLGGLTLPSPPPQPDGPPVSLAERQLVETLQPQDTRLYGVANNALNAWISKLGKKFAVDLAALRKLRRNRERNCTFDTTNNTASSLKCGPPPNMEEESCERWGFWAGWCSLSSHLPLS